MFGGLSGMTGVMNVGSTGWTNTYIAYQGAVVNNGGTYEFDNGVTVADSANCIAFWSYISDKLLAFRYNSSGVLETVYHWSSVATAPTQGMALSGSGSVFASTAGQQTAATPLSLYGKRNSAGTGYYNAGITGQHYLSLSVVDGSFNGFGAKTTNWSYGFVLQDDWHAGSVGNQLLAPTGANYFINTLSAFGIGSSPSEYVQYGDETIATSTSTNGTTWDVSTTGWKIANAGDLVVVTYDGTGTDTWKIYVEGVLRFSSTSVDTYMASSVTTSELRFGDSSPSADGKPDNYDETGGWIARLDNLFVANGTAFDQTAVTNLVAAKADLTAAGEYANITHYATFDGSGATSVKGGLLLSRGDISYT